MTSLALGRQRARAGDPELDPARQLALEAEEVYVVLSGSGRVKLDDDIVEIAPLDAIRVAPKVMRAFEAGPEGLELLAFGPRHDGDGQVVRDWWTD